jgi:phage tail-like protein
MADKYRNYKFELEIDGFVRAGFQKVTGMGATTEEITYREGGENETPHKLPGQTTFKDITLERGYSDDSDFQDWYSQIFDIDQSDGVQGDDEFRKTVTIYLKDKAGNRVVKWTVENAWPKDKAVADLDASANDVLIETLILANEGQKEERL